ncbi:MAG TPA: NADH-quinone oxidoreductase subunit G, partial [Rhodanobacteraceae bacterium]|nr:NADH-quinone oxidoreductase subunit G [Rhodanobacteraceae bacterium]
LGAALALGGFDFTEIGEVRAQIRDGDVAATKKASFARPSSAGAGKLERIATTATYRADAVLRRTPSLQAHPLTRGAMAILNPEDGLALGLGQGAKASVGGVSLPVELSARVPRGAVWIEAGYAATATLPPYGSAIEISKGAV